MKTRSGKVSCFPRSRNRDLGHPLLVLLLEFQSSLPCAEPIHLKEPIEVAYSRQVKRFSYPRSATMGASTQRSLGSGLQNRMPVFWLDQVAAAARVRSGQDLHASKKNRERSPTDQLLSMRWWERHSDGTTARSIRRNWCLFPFLESFHLRPSGAKIWGVPSAITGCST